MISVCPGPRPMGEQLLFVVRCVLMFARLHGACIQMRSAAAYTHPSALFCGATSPLIPKVQAPALLKTTQCLLKFCPFLSPMAYITGYCANGKLLCLLITTLSLGCRRRSDAMCRCVHLCVCVGMLRGRAVERSPLRVKSQPFSFREHH